MRSRLMWYLVLVGILCLFLPAAGFTQENPFGDAGLESGAVGRVVTDTPIEAGLAVVEAPYVLGVLSDLHIRKENLDSCRRTIKTLNALPGAQAAIILGDICAEVATPAEFTFAMDVLGRITLPVFAVPGNHDFLYADKLGRDGKKDRGTRAVKTAKLERFRQAFGQKSNRFALEAGGHLLVFLPVDALNGKSIATLSEATLRYFKETLAQHPKVPTIVFTHAPLEGSYTDENVDLPLFHATTQPAEKVRTILRNHPQVFLWVAGHRHIKPSSPDFCAANNKVAGVTVIHVPNITPTQAWVQHIELLPASARVKTIDAKTGKALTRFTRSFSHTPASPTHPNPASGFGVTLPTPGSDDAPKPAVSTGDLEQARDRIISDLKGIFPRLFDFFRSLFN